MKHAYFEILWVKNVFVSLNITGCCTIVKNSTISGSTAGVLSGRRNIYGRSRYAGSIRRRRCSTTGCRLCSRCWVSKYGREMYAKDRTLDSYILPFFPLTLMRISNRIHSIIIIIIIIIFHIYFHLINLCAYTIPLHSFYYQ